MKVKVSRSEVTELNYPILMEHIVNNTIVYFISPNSGLLIDKGKAGHQKLVIGQLYQCWAEAHDVTQWTVYNGTITLSNI